MGVQKLYHFVVKRQVKEARELIVEKKIDVNSAPANVVQELRNQKSRYENYKCEEIAKGAIMRAAIESGSSKMVKLLIDSKANLDIVDKNKYTVLHTAVNKRQPQILGILLDMGASNLTT